jgi:hypothetical protein
VNNHKNKIRERGNACVKSKILRGYLSRKSLSSNVLV